MRLGRLVPRIRACASSALWLATLVFLIGGPPARAQEEPAVTFRTTTRLVEVSVIALDKKGEPVTDLARDDFEIAASGDKRAVELFRYESAEAEVPEAPEPLPKGTFSNRVELSPGPPRNITALVMDNLNSLPQQGPQIRWQLLRYLAALTPESRVAVFQMGKDLRVLHDFTDDADSLRERVESAFASLPLKHEVDMMSAVDRAEQVVAAASGEEAELMAQIMQMDLETDMLANAYAQADRIARSLNAMESLARHLSGIPGRKSLVWITGGFSMLNVTGELVGGTRSRIESYESEVRDTSRRLAQQGVSLYIVDAAGLESLPTFDTSARPAVQVPSRQRRFDNIQSSVEISTDPRSTMTLMASITGGRYLYDTNDLMKGFRQAVNDIRGSYTVGFYDDAIPDGKWHTLRVRVKRSGVDLRHRRGYLAEETDSAVEDWTGENWQSAVSNPVGSSAILMTASLTPASDGEAGAFDVALRISADSLYFREEDGKMLSRIQVVLADRTADGMLAPSGQMADLSIPLDNWDQVKQEGILFNRKWKPDSRAARTRIIVRDPHTGAYGTLDVPVKSLVAETAQPTD